MPLGPAQRAALALRLCSAMHLDRAYCPIGDTEGVDLVKGARGNVEGTAEQADLFIKSGNQIAPYLRAQADRLDALPRGSATAKSIGLVKAAAQHLRDIANSNVPDGDGDGPVLAGEGSPRCRCGVLDWAAEVETRVRALLEQHVALPVEAIPKPEVIYETALTDDDRDFAPFCISGQVFIAPPPRKVKMQMRAARSFSSRDLWHIAYTLHHELVCHAFQGAFATGPLNDAHPKCHWSEGWMDTLAFDLVSEWCEAPPAWLRTRGDSAKDALRQFHGHRYERPVGLDEDDISRRQRARDAYRKLRSILVGHLLVHSEEEADKVIRRFSFAANTHRDADSKRLRTLGSMLQQQLMNTARSGLPVKAAQACLAFSVDRDLAKLERTVESHRR